MARRDDRFYVQVTLDALSPTGKLAGAHPGAKWLWLAGLIVCRRDLLDGLIRPATAAAEAEVAVKHAKELDSRGLWHNPGHDCDRCPQPPVGLMVIHDYLDHQQSAADVDALRAKRSAAGKKGADSRWHSKSDGKSHGNSHGNPIAESESEPESLVTSSRHLTVIPGEQVTTIDLEAIRRATGGDASHAQAVADDVLSRGHGPQIQNPTAYVLRAVGAEPDRYKPTARNPRKDELCPQPGHSGWAGSCIQCAADGKAAR